MITLRKLAGLSEGTRGRKLLSLLDQDLDPEFLRGVVALAQQLLGEAENGSNDTRSLYRLRLRLARHLGIDVAEWDLQAPPDRLGVVKRFPFSVWLDDLRSPFNVGSIIRSAEAYGFQSVWHSPDSPGIDHPRTARSSMGAQLSIEVGVRSLSELRDATRPIPVFALELGGTPVHDFVFPPEGIVLVGGEEVGLSPEALHLADGSAGRVSLPLYGQKASLNVGVAFGIVAEAWTRKVLNA